ncbi:Hypothetical_protein [Hexamita inflata]|uniref:Hypothetical_protein n=1 Tax=Hexamita inflata TaxID=28002 RepID=A0AA86R6Q8_9EUKA|nr:Hypothetical protein HINF_LOCUS50635 [Hexamita inflata]
MFIFAQATKSSDIQLEMQQVSQFAVFGFNIQKQDILDSDIFVTINYSILTGALICMQCDIDIQRSQLQFVAHGVQISALILRSLNIVQISRVHISFRFSSNFSSGLINHINQSLTTFTISESILTGFNNYSSVSNGYIYSKLSVDIQIEIDLFQVCVDNMQRFGVSSFIVVVSGSEQLICSDVCSKNNYVTYGLCSSIPDFSTLLLNSTVICEFPFVFNSFSNICECAFGYFLNLTYCVNVIQQFSTVQRNATNLEISIKNEIQKTEIEVKTAFIGLEQLILSNVSALTQHIDDIDKVINQNIISANETIHKNIYEMKTDNANKFSTLTELIENKHILTQNQLTNVQNVLKNQLDAQNTLITDNQFYIKNNFTVQKDQISNLKISIDTRFSTIDSSIWNAISKLNDMKTQLQSSQTSIETKIGGVSSLITSTVATQTVLNDIITQITDVQNYMATQTYLKTIYESLSNALNGISMCKIPGSVNQGGICRCVYDGGLDNFQILNQVFCEEWNSCCVLTENQESMGFYKYYCYGIGQVTLRTKCTGSRAYI